MFLRKIYFQVQTRKYLLPYYVFQLANDVLIKISSYTTFCKIVTCMCRHYNVHLFIWFLELLGMLSFLFNMKLHKIYEIIQGVHCESIAYFNPLILDRNQSLISYWFGTFHIKKKNYFKVFNKALKTCFS